MRKLLALVEPQACDLVVNRGISAISTLTDHWGTKFTKLYTVQHINFRKKGDRILKKAVACL